MEREKIRWLMNRLDQFGDRDFLALDNTSIKYSELLNKIYSWQKVFEENKIPPRACVAIIGDYSCEGISLYLSLVVNSNVIVYLDPSSAESHAEYTEVAQVQFVIRILDDGKFSVADYRQNLSHPLILKQIENGDPTLIIFSSGTTGIPKAAVLSVSRLLTRYTRIRERRDRILTFLKLDHIGGVNTLFSSILSGSTIVLSNRRDVRSICYTIASKKVSLLPTTPTFLNMMLLSLAHEKFDLSSLKLVTYGTEPMPESTLTAISNTLSWVAFKQTYGLTELGIFATKSLGSKSNWMKVGGEGVEIDIRDGLLWIKSEMCMLGYLNLPSPFDREGWYFTGDRVDEKDGFIRILGRDSDVINVGGEKVFPSEVESVLLEMPNIVDATVSAKSSPVTGNVVSAMVVLKYTQSLSELRQQIQSYCSSRLQRFKIPSFITIVDKIEVSSRYKKVRVK